MTRDRWAQIKAAVSLEVKKIFSAKRPQGGPTARDRWAQIKAVMRLEIKKTFFAKRGLWIYLVAALPILLFIASAIVTSSQQNRTASLALKNERPLTYQDLLAVKEGMTTEEVMARLGKPPSTSHWVERRPSGPGTWAEVAHDNYHYSDGQNDLYLRMTNGAVEFVHIREGYNLGDSSILFAGVFQFFFIRLAVFFGCLGIFMNLFRGEILDRSLHFYFLAPIRREILMAGKFLAGLVATCAIFASSELLQTIAFLWSLPPSLRGVYLFHYHGLEHAGVYLGVTVLACVGYGAFFLVAGMLFRNPILPTAVILIWEAINPFLPAVLKQISVIYYLKSLCPVEIPAPPGMPPLFALLVSNSDPISAPLAVGGVILVTLLALYVSSRQVCRMEINYASE
jgi:ABC-type transport system involved in multi-copper enzyme maturation permease subunit